MCKKCDKINFKNVLTVIPELCFKPYEEGTLVLKQVVVGI